MMQSIPSTNDELVLYNWPTSTCSQKVRLVLAEKSLRFEDRRLDSSKSENLSDWYLKLNENGVVPTLTHGQRVIIDSSVIAEYLDEVFPASPLSPSDPYKRARMRIWRQFIDEVPTPAIRVPSYNRYIRHKWKNMSEEAFSKLVEKRTVRKHFYRNMGLEGSSQEEENQAIEKLRETVNRMERSLTENPWVSGEQFTLADIALIPTLVRMSDIGLGHVWNDKPHVAAWFERVQARPSFTQTFYPGSRYGAEGSHPALESLPAC
ncbi:glutathione S-transferase family protein [Rhodoplanes sp. Z2-YC6860]|uniref:glutathione S-transferase family protein n=1 Tax=Rhodoplanes sp. Z2-YC6860 TaxID=674703 RepID=UPI00078BD88D|nr:glutathione S-transferase family protein [Rhodoplanes sp. Z2-YC6860]AMN39096.1 glutathione S-transferase domain-containing protein [Rhodoplanes sp. Z2-YC6860]